MPASPDAPPRTAERGPFRRALESAASVAGVLRGLVRALEFAGALLVAFTLSAGAAAAQAPDSAAGSGRTWAFTASAYLYALQAQADYVQPTVTADREALHLEARYNYEALDAGSAWVGYNLGTGKTVSVEFTPMVGVVVGDLSAIGLGYEGSLSWKRLELYSQGEYVVDTEDSSGDYFYSWSQLIYSPAAWVNVGLLTQRTRTYDTGRDIDRGPFVGVTYRAVSLTTFVVNPDDDPTVIVALEVDF